MKNKTELSSKDLELLQAFSKSCRHSILAMTTNAESGHPGGSLSCIDYLSLLYTQIISKSGEVVIVSNGHISPAVYAVLAEMGYTPKESVIKGFRKIGKIYEGHVTRHVPGVWYGTGPLGCGISAATGFALAEKYHAGLEPLEPGKGKPRNVYALLGDGESEEGQVYEMMNFAAKYKLDNLIAFMDYNEVQLSDGLEHIMPFDPKAIFTAGGWNVLDVDGHDMRALWKALKQAWKSNGKPTLLFAHTIMGKGVAFMEQEGRARKATWHGKTAKASEAEAALLELKPSDKEEKLLQTFRKKVAWKPKAPSFPKLLSENAVKTDKPILYKSSELTDCRSAYGKALLDLASHNKNIIALTADLAGSVRTDYVKNQIPERHIEVGIAEQHMVSCSGGLSLAGIIPFCSTFGAFMTSRARDQARVNDINHTNVKMVATHCGLSVGEDGPTHQAIDDMNSMLGLFNTMQIEPADPNHCDRMVRYIASHYGNFYMRMGRHKIPVLTKEDGSPFFDEAYNYYYGRSDILRKGTDLTIVASGGVSSEALKAVESLKHKGIEAELVIVSSIKVFDKAVFDSIKKTRRLLTVEDHNVQCGLGMTLGSYLAEHGINIKAFKKLGVKEYQLSGTAEELYDAAEISARWVEKYARDLL